MRDDAVLQSVDAFRRVIRALRLAEREVVARAGMSAAQLFVLRQLAGGEAASLTELASLTMTDRSSVAAVVQRLAEDGLVVTGRDAADRRRVTVRLSAAGTRLLRRAPAAPTELLVAAIRELPATARTSLARGLRALLRELALEEGPVPMLFEEEGRRPRRSRARRGSRPA